MAHRRNRFQQLPKAKPATLPGRDVTERPPRVCSTNIRAPRGGSARPQRHYRAPGALCGGRFKRSGRGLGACGNVWVGVLGVLAGVSFSAAQGGPGKLRRLLPKPEGENGALHHVSQRKMIRRKAPLGFLKRVFKRQKPHLRLKTSSDLLVRFCPFIDWQWGGDRSRKQPPQPVFRRPSSQSAKAPINTLTTRCEESTHW